MTKVKPFGTPAQPSSAPYDQDMENVADLRVKIAKKRADEIARFASSPSEQQSSVDANNVPEGVTLTRGQKVAAAIGAAVLVSIPLGVPNTLMVNLGFRDVPTVTTSENIDQP